MKIRSVPSRRFLVRCALAGLVAGGIALLVPRPAPAYTTGPACGVKQYTSPEGVGFRILFANNGTVQMYEVTAKADNTEAVNDARMSLERTYGPAGWNAPALKIIAFKKGDSGGMMIPEKAIDSCGRTISLD